MVASASAHATTRAGASGMRKRDWRWVIVSQPTIGSAMASVVIWPIVRVCLLSESTTQPMKPSQGVSAH
ncbi:hypothetical protein COB72_08220 [bacterium]|nr:MAG: hypothetical protein COB72_08220 [bacterium]